MQLQHGKQLREKFLRRCYFIYLVVRNFSRTGFDLAGGWQLTISHFISNAVRPARRACFEILESKSNFFSTCSIQYWSLQFYLFVADYLHALLPNEIVQYLLQCTLLEIVQILVAE